MTTARGDISPIADEESRETLDMECKYSTAKSDKDIRLQLQANMYNLLVRDFIKKLESVSSLKELSKVLELKRLTIYGMSLGTIGGVEVSKF